MTDYTELIRQLKTYEDGYGLYDDAADAIEALDAKADYWMGQAQEEYEKRLRQMPKRGVWIHNVAVQGTTAGGVMYYHGYTCSVCGALMGRKGDKYCYNCGAKMEVQDESQNNRSYRE